MPLLATRGAASAKGFGLLNNIKDIPTVIGQPFGGGFYAGKISTNGSGVADYYLIVGPKASAETNAQWGPVSNTGATSEIDGFANSQILNSPTYPAAYFCRNLSIGGYTDWYLPSIKELGILYCSFKPYSGSNSTNANTANAYSVPPRGAYTNSPTQDPTTTTATDFLLNNSEVLPIADFTYSSTDYASNLCWYTFFASGLQDTNYKNQNYYVRAVRRIPV